MNWLLWIGCLDEGLGKSQTTFEWSTHECSVFEVIWKITSHLEKMAEKHTLNRLVSKVHYCIETLFLSSFFYFLLTSDHWYWVKLISEVRPKISVNEIPQNYPKGWNWDCYIWRFNQIMIEYIFIQINSNSHLLTCLRFPINPLLITIYFLH